MPIVVASASTASRIGESILCSTEKRADTHHMGRSSIWAVWLLGTEGCDHVMKDLYQEMQRSLVFINAVCGIFP